MSKKEQMSLWAIDVDGSAYQLGGSYRLNLATTRGVVPACSPQEALNAADDLGFKIGIKNATADEPAEIVISGFIGDPYDGCDAKSVQNFMRANRGKPVTAYIDSGGGFAWDGIAMHNAFIHHDAPVTAIIQSIAGSAATLPAVGASVTKIYDNATFFIHRAAVIAFGNRDQMSEAMDWLDSIDDAIARTYKAKTNKAIDKIHSQMAGKGKQDGTIFDAREAVAEKYCTEVVSLKNTNAKNAAGSPQSATNPDMAESPRFIEAARAMRLRTHSQLFVPSGG